MTPAQVEKLKRDIAEAKAALRIVRKKNASLKKKADSMKRKISRSKQQEVRLKQNLQGKAKRTPIDICISQDTIAKCQDPDFIEQLCVDMYALARGKADAVESILSVLNQTLPLNLKMIPSADTIEDWVKKRGLPAKRPAVKPQWKITHK
jgi:chromosome segregation ATPase